MENENKFLIKNVIGKKIYRYVDSNGVKGRVHISKSPLTPLKCFTENGRTYVKLDYHQVPINNMEELDSINNALNNHGKSLQKLIETPSSVIADTNPDLYLKIIDAIRESLIHVKIKNKRDSLEVYACLSYLVKKETKIKAQMRKNKIRNAENIKHMQEKEQ